MECWGDCLRVLQLLTCEFAIHRLEPAATDAGPLGPTGDAVESYEIVLYKESLREPGVSLTNVLWALLRGDLPRLEPDSAESRLALQITAMPNPVTRP